MTWRAHIGELSDCVEFRPKTTKAGATANYGFLPRATKLSVALCDVEVDSNKVNPPEDGKKIEALNNGDTLNAFAIAGDATKSYVQLVAFVNEPSGPRTFVNPLPYLEYMIGNFAETHALPVAAQEIGAPSVVIEQFQASSGVFTLLGQATPDASGGSHTISDANTTHVRMRLELPLKNAAPAGTLQLPMDEVDVRVVKFLPTGQCVDTRLSGIPGTTVFDASDTQHPDQGIGKKLLFRPNANAQLNATDRERSLYDVSSTGPMRMFVPFGPDTLSSSSSS